MTVPTLDYSTALLYVQAMNKMFPRAPVNVGVMMNIISDYRKRLAFFQYERVQFFEYLVRRVKALDVPNPYGPGMSLVQYVPNGPIVAVEHASINPGWWSPDDVERLKSKTLLSGVFHQSPEALIAAFDAHRTT